MPNLPSVFISYRQQASGDVARYMNDRLVTMGLKVFFDADGIHVGDNWRAILEKNLLESQFLVVILAPTTLDSEWVRREVEFALRHKKPIIPIFTGGLLNLYDVDFSQYSEQISALRDIQGIEYHYKRSQVTFDSLAEALQLDMPPSPHPLPFSPPVPPTKEVVRAPQSSSNPLPFSPRPPIPEPSSKARRSSLGRLVSPLIVVLGLLFAFLALFPEQTRTEWFRSLGLLPSLTLVPSPTLVASTSTQEPLVPTNSPVLPTIELPSDGTVVQSIALDTTATEIMLQRTVDAKQTVNAELFAQSTHLAETANAIPSMTFTLQPTDTPQPPSVTAATPSPTATLNPTPVPPTMTYLPTNTLQPSSTLASARGYPCPATVSGNNITFNNILRSKPEYNASRSGSLQSGQSVWVLDKVLQGARTYWYPIGYDKQNPIGYVSDDVLNFDPSCPQ